MKNFFFLMMGWMMLNAQIPAYYQTVDFSQSAENVKAQLSNLIITTHTNQLFYTPDTWNALKQTDLDPENSANVLLVYGYDDTDAILSNDRSRDKNASCHVSGCTGLWVREHVYPRSLGTPPFDTEDWAGADAHALRASDATMNNVRGNKLFAAGSGNAQSLGTTTFFPGEEWKGDVARMMMYMFLRYPTQCLPNNVASGSHNYHSDMPDVLLQWNAEDPVSELEAVRNDILQSAFQGNRNPFIDNPYLATVIWGGPNAANTWSELSVQDINLTEMKLQLYPNPTTDYVYYEGNNFRAVEVYNLSGQQVVTDSDLTDGKTQMPSQPGIYVIRFVTDTTSVAVKVIKK